MPETLRAALQRRDVADAGELLRQWSDSGVSGGRRMHWNICSRQTLCFSTGRVRPPHGGLLRCFESVYPLVTLEESRMVVNSSGFVTAGAALAHIDLALWLIRRSSPALAALTARFLVIEPAHHRQFSRFLIILRMRTPWWNGSSNGRD